MCVFFKRQQDHSSSPSNWQEIFPPSSPIRRSTSAGRRCGPRCTQDCSCKSALPAPPPGTGTGACSSWLRGDKARQVLIRPAGGATANRMQQGRCILLADRNAPGCLLSTFVHEEGRCVEAGPDCGATVWDVGTSPHVGRLLRVPLSAVEGVAVRWRWRGGGKERRRGGGEERRRRRRREEEERRSPSLKQLPSVSRSTGIFGLRASDYLPSWIQTPPLRQCWWRRP